MISSDCRSCAGIAGGAGVFRVSPLAPVLLLMAFLLFGCGALPAGGDGANVRPQADGAQADGAAVLKAAALDEGERLRVVATTNIIADVVANVGGEAIEVASLMPVGADPHSFTPTPQDLRTLNDAHVILVNGLGLEESLLPILENLDQPTPIVSVNADVETLALGDWHGHEDEAHEDETHEDETHEDEAHEEGSADPHTWFSVSNVMVWTENIAETLGALDPATADVYAAGAAAYGEQLMELDAQLRAQVETVPADHRKLVTDHVALAYLAEAYGFEVVGSVLPSLSTLASASAQELAALTETMRAQGVLALFVSTTVNAQTAGQLAKDLGIPVVELYIGSLSEADGAAPSYVALIRTNMERIVEALR